MNKTFVTSSKPKKHKRKIKHQLILTSNSLEKHTRAIHINIDAIFVFVLLIAIFLGVSCGVLYYQKSKMADGIRFLEEAQQQIADLEEEKEQLGSEIDALNEKIVILSETINTKVASEAELTEVIEAQSIPSDFPLTGAASIEESVYGANEEGEGGEPICIFTATEGTTVIATAAGTVSEIGDDTEYGHYVVIDHGNGYITIYRNKGDVMVKQSDTVAQGTTLFIIATDNTILGYQLQDESGYINPMSLLEISG